ncbi:hypothetical protein V8E36_009222 [Tilletia maclaganii]
MKLVATVPALSLAAMLFTSIAFDEAKASDLPKDYATLEKVFRTQVSLVKAATNRAQGVLAGTETSPKTVTELLQVAKAATNELNRIKDHFATIEKGAGSASKDGSSSSKGGGSSS